MLHGGRAKTIPVAERSPPRTICPLIMSSFGAVVDAVAAGATCDGKMKMNEVLADHGPTFVLDLPQKPGSLETIEYFLSELRRFAAFITDLIETTVTDDD